MHVEFVCKISMYMQHIYCTEQVAPAYSADGTVAVTVTTSTATAVAVVLTTAAPGYFSQNAFTATPGDLQIRFIPFQRGEGSEAQVLAQLKATTRIEHMAQHTL